MYLLVCACARTLTVETRACALVTSPQCVRSTLYVTRADRGRIGCAVKSLIIVLYSGDLLVRGEK